MKRLAIAGFCLLVLFGNAPPAKAHGFSFGFSFGHGGHHGFYGPYGFYPAYAAAPPGYCGYYPPVYAPGIYFPGSALGLRHYVPYYNYGVYRGYMPRYRYYYGGRGFRRDHYTPRRHYRRTYFRD